MILRFLCRWIILWSVVPALASLLINVVQGQAMLYVTSLTTAQADPADGAVVPSGRVDEEAPWPGSPMAVREPTANQVVRIDRDSSR